MENVARDTIYVSDSVFVFSRDTVYINSLDPEIVRHYTEILEKTNNQLSVWSNPYGLFIAALGILVALFTIVAAIIHFKQTSDYKQQVNATILGYQTILDNYIAQKDKALTTIIEDRLQQLQDEKLKIGNKQIADPESENAIKDIDEKINKLEKTKSGISEKKVLGRHLPHKIARGFLPRDEKLIGFYETLCRHCGKRYIVSGNKKYKGSVCPHCNIINAISDPKSQN